MLRRDPLIPPRRLQRYGRTDFVEAGDAYLGHLRDLARADPSQRILDVGCGTGRLARPLAGFLDPAAGGAYDGFDLDRRAIGWCRRAYRRRPHFRFLLADVFHPRLHPGGGHLAAEYRFPYADGSFELVLSASVFPHMLEADTARYLSEAGRVLRPGGRLFATFFVLDDDSRARMAAGEAALSFLDPEQHVAVLSEDLPDEAVAYDRDWLRARLAEAGCELATIERGAWRGGDGRDLLDTVVAVRA